MFPTLPIPFSAFYTTPGAPQNPQVSSITPSTFFISWEAPAEDDDGFNSITAYNITTTATSDSSSSSLVVPSSSLNATVTLLEANSQYTTSVAAVNDAGSGLASTTISLTTLGNAYCLLLLFLLLLLLLLLFMD